MCMGENKMDKRKEKSIGEVLSEHEKEVIKYIDSCRKIIN